MPELYWRKSASDNAADESLPLGWREEAPSQISSCHEKEKKTPVAKQQEPSPVRLFGAFSQGLRISDFLQRSPASAWGLSYQQELSGVKLGPSPG